MLEMQETWVRSLGGEDPLEEEMAACSSILVWRIPWTEESGGLQSMESQKSQKQLSNQTTTISIDNKSEESWSSCCKICLMSSLQQQPKTLALWYGIAKGLFQFFSFLLCRSGESRLLGPQANHQCLQTSVMSSVKWDFKWYDVEWGLSEDGSCETGV